MLGNVNYWFLLSIIMYFYMLPVFGLETQLILVESSCVISSNIESNYKTNLTSGSVELIMLIWEPYLFGAGRLWIIFDMIFGPISGYRIY